jgi:serine protease inhibitor
MRLFLFAVSILVVACATVQCADKVRGIDDLTGSEQSLLSSCNKFSVDMFRQVVANAPATQNVFVSPLSVSYALGLCYNGAVGKTREAIGNTLQLAGLSLDELDQAYHNLTEILIATDPEVDLQIGNSFWSDQGKPIRAEFIDLAKTWFDARVEEIDFQAPGAADEINAWVSRATNGKITKMIQPPINSNIAAILFNAIYFKGKWRCQFDQDRTRADTFHLADGATSECRMMHIGSHDCEKPSLVSWYSDPEVWVLDMPYGGGNYRMSIIVPNRDTDDINDIQRSIDEVIADLTEKKWRTWQGGDTPGKFSLSLPRFKFSLELSLSSLLKTLGMEIAFDRARADFSNLFADTVGWIDEIKQKTFIQVDEKGTEAAAVTEVLDVSAAMPNSRHEIVCDRPFLIVIHEDVSGAILFIGRIANPVWEEE